MTDGVFQKNSLRQSAKGRNDSYGRSSKSDNDMSRSGFSRIFLSMAKAAVFGIVTASVMLLALSFLAVFYDIPDMVLNYIIIAVSMICLFLVGFKAAGYNSKNGLLIGILTGFFYTVLLYAAACILWNSVDISPEILIDLAAGSAISGLGGFIGINRRAKNKKRR